MARRPQRNTRVRNGLFVVIVIAAIAYGLMSA